MPPPSAPLSPSLNILPSNQSAINPSSSQPLPHFPPTASVAGPSMGDNTGVGPGPGPLRHPRPLTAADLHLQLEKEQEAVVCHTSHHHAPPRTNTLLLGQPPDPRALTPPRRSKRLGRLQRLLHLGQRLGYRARPTVERQHLPARPRHKPLPAHPPPPHLLERQRPQFHRQRRLGIHHLTRGALLAGTRPPVRSTPDPNHRWHAAQQTE
jgi:hypothetical protein